MLIRLERITCTHSGAADTKESSQLFNETKAWSTELAVIRSEGKRGAITKARPNPPVARLWFKLGEVREILRRRDSALVLDQLLLSQKENGNAIDRSTHLALEGLVVGDAGKTR
jgi:hypothetical protein